MQENHHPDTIDGRSSCDSCNMWRKVYHCAKHESLTCKYCKCMDCLSPEQQIQIIEKKILSLYESISYYRTIIREIKKEHNLMDDDKSD